MIFISAFCAAIALALGTEDMELPDAPYDLSAVWVDYGLVLENYPILMTANVTDSEMRSTVKALARPLRDYQDAVGAGTSAKKLKASVVGMLTYFGTNDSFSNTSISDETWQDSNIDGSVLSRDSVEEALLMRNAVFESILDGKNKTIAIKQCRSGVKAYSKMISSASDDAIEKMVASEGIDWGEYFDEQIDLMQGVLSTDPVNLVGPVRDYLARWLYTGKTSAAKLVALRAKASSAPPSDDDSSAESTSSSKDSDGGLFASLKVKKSAKDNSSTGSTSATAGGGQASGTSADDPASDSSDESGSSAGFFDFLKGKSDAKGDARADKKANRTDAKADRKSTRASKKADREAAREDRKEAPSDDASTANSSRSNFFDFLNPNKSTEDEDADGNPTGTNKRAERKAERQARQDDRKQKRDDRKEKRDGKQDARKEKRDDKQEARQQKRDDKQDARKEKRADRYAAFQGQNSTSASSSESGASPRDVAVSSLYAVTIATVVAICIL